jgi:hypothetical protein
VLQLAFVNVTLVFLSLSNDRGLFSSMGQLSVSENLSFNDPTSLF